MTAAVEIDQRARRRRAEATQNNLDRADLEQRLEALRRKSPRDDPTFRREAVELFRERLEERRADARGELEAGGGGRACAKRLSDLEDNLIRAIFDWALRYFHPQPPASARPSVVAVGGYGRGLLAPGSDIDLLFLLPEAPTPETQAVIETMLYALWDLRQKVGHATRSIDDCLSSRAAT